VAGCIDGARLYRPPAQACGRFEGADIDAVADPLVISIDAMGGDHGPSIVLPGVAKALQSHPAAGLRFLLHGEMAAMRMVRSSTPCLADVCELLRPSDGVISMDAKLCPRHAAGQGHVDVERCGKRQDREARAAVSAGNTGALMAIGRPPATHDGTS
jgi:glycerol-3-phosphate acyltransferase PlsX